MISLKKILQGDKLAIARTISVVENDSNVKILEQIFPYTGNAYHIGITGPRGAGKSTLVNVIAEKLLKGNKKIGIIAVDPTSPFSGGALLGDRIRMTDLALNKNVFIRSMASRGSLGGLAQKTKDATFVLDAAGMDYILIETIGVGQVELDELLSKREKINHQLQTIIDRQSDPWGIKVSMVEVKHIDLLQDVDGKIYKQENYYKEKWKNKSSFYSNEDQ